MNAPSLFDLAPQAHDTEAAPRRRAQGGPRESFEDFHARNPHVFETLRDAALKAKASGWRVFGMKALIESLRWDRRLTTDGKPWKLNNNHVSAYARLLMEQVPELRGFFRLRD